MPCAKPCIPWSVAGGDLRLAVLGVVSLLIWALILVVTLKYVVFLMRADNRGEGGILSLVVLVETLLKKKGGLVLALGMIGAAFFFGDAMITPAMSVLSAVEGLKVINTGLRPVRRAAHAGHALSACSCSSTRARRAWPRCSRRSPPSGLPSSA